MSNGAFDHRGSSIATAVDTCIERIVDHFESNDSALRLDVLRALSNQAKLAFETTRVREHLIKHPVSSDLYAGLTSQSPVYKILVEQLTVDSCSCVYDFQRNVVMTTDVRWTLESKCSPKRSKKRKTTSNALCKEKRTMLTTYRFERVRNVERDERETLIKFTVIVAFGDEDATPRELLHFEMACEHAYPKSYYESQQQVASEEIEDDTKEETQTRQQLEEKEQENDECESIERNKKDFGEELRSFRFSNEVLVDMGGWMGAGDEELDPVDVIGFFMALPVYEDEWLMDERVCEILFQGDVEFCTDEESRENDNDEVDVDGE